MRPVRCSPRDVPARRLNSPAEEAEIRREGIYLLCLFLGALPAGAGFGQGAAGAEACRGCHEDRYGTYIQSVHGKKGVPGSPAQGEGCESCHGPGATHMDKGGGKGGLLSFEDPQIGAEAKSAPCLSCHGENKGLAFWELGRHKRGKVSCQVCHLAHQTGRRNLKEAEPDLCHRCHLNVRAQQNKQSHHPLREGRMKCTDCHDPHGGFGLSLIRGNWVNELCYRCHAEKRGPFMWSHPPVDENCLVCHTPHGSNHSKLLTSKAPQLCQSCHDWTRHPGAIYTRFETFQGPAAAGKNRMFARSCLNCHSNIHGSNGPSIRGKTFVR